MRERVSGVVRAREGGRARLREVESVASWKAVFESDARARDGDERRGRAKFLSTAEYEIRITNTFLKCMTGSMCSICPRLLGNS